MRAAEYFEAAANQGDAEAAYNLGVMRLLGQDGAAPDPARADELFESAIAQDFAPALNGIGRSKSNRSEAFEYFRRAAAKHSADGHFNMGSCYRTGSGVNKSTLAAMMHFKIASALGQVAAQWELGEAYYRSDS